MHNATNGSANRISNLKYPGQRKRYPVIPAAQLSEEIRPPMLVDDLLPGDSLAVIYGPPGCAKSFVALTIAAAVASGAPLGHLRTRQGGVVYVAAERATGIRSRLEAYRLEHASRALPESLWFVPRAVPLSDPNEVDAFVQEVTATLVPPPALIVFDTLARCMGGTDENSAQGMNTIVESLDRIRRATAASVLVVHHTRKGDDIERGSTALRGAADVMHLARKRDDVVELTCAKVNDFAELPTLRLQLVPIGPSCVMRPLVVGDPAGESPEPSRSVRDADILVLRALAACPMSMRAWAASAAVSRSTLTDRNQRWTRAGITHKTHDGLQQLTDAGRRLIDVGKPGAEAA